MSDAILTLEPLMEAVQEGVEALGWSLSGMQKTTSHHFEGRWEGDSTRSAYLFFHRDDRWPEVSLDVYLDETSRGLQGNLALVVPGRPLPASGDAARVLRELSALARAALPEGYRTPVSVRYRVPDGDTDVERADVEVRFKLRIPATAIDAGGRAVTTVASAATEAFEGLLGRDDLEAVLEVR